MQLQHINIENLKTASINVRKKGAKDVDNLLPSIRSLGLLQPLLVRPKTLSAECEGFEIVAGQRGVIMPWSNWQMRALANPFLVSSWKKTMMPKP